MSKSSQKVYLVGYSGHAYVIGQSANTIGIAIEGYLDKRASEQNPLNLKYFGNEDNDEFIGWDEPSAFILGIGDNKVRTLVSKKLRERGKACLTIIDPSALIGEMVEIEDGTFISRGAIVNVLSIIGQDVIINTGAIIEHECHIESGVHVAPGAVLLGNVTVGKNSFVGANSVVKQGVRIGSNVIIGAGSVVVNDLDAGVKVVGNPAKRLLL